MVENIFYSFPELMGTHFPIILFGVLKEIAFCRMLLRIEHRVFLTKSIHTKGPDHSGLI